MAVIGSPPSVGAHDPQIVFAAVFMAFLIGGGILGVISVLIARRKSPPNDR